MGVVGGEKVQIKSRKGMDETDEEYRRKRRDYKEGQGEGAAIEIRKKKKNENKTIRSKGKEGGVSGGWRMGDDW